MPKFVKNTFVTVLFLLSSVFTVLIVKNVFASKIKKIEKPVINSSGPLITKNTNTKNVMKISGQKQSEDEQSGEKVEKKKKKKTSLKSIIFQIIGYVSSVLVFSAFYMKTMIPLRIVAICSNFTFITYALLGGLYPILVLHSVLLPLNVHRLRQMLKLIKKVKEASQGGNNLEFLTPYMTSEEYESGQILFNKGDKADKIYFIKNGDIVLPEIQKGMGAGATLGEVGIFAPDNVRACSAVASGKVEALTITSEKVLQLYYQNPTFGFFLIRTIAEIASKGSEQKTGMVVALDELEKAESNFEQEIDIKDQETSPDASSKVSNKSTKDTIEDDEIIFDDDLAIEDINRNKKLDLHVEENIIYFLGELIWPEIQTFTDEIEKLKEINKPMILDVSNVYKFDSSGTGLLIALFNVLPETQLRINEQLHDIKNASDIITHVLESLVFR